MVSMEFNGLDAGEIKRRPEVETLLVTRDNRTEVMRKVLNWLTEGSSPLTGEDLEPVLSLSVLFNDNSIHHTVCHFVK
jgi:hypothetical protein